MIARSLFCTLALLLLALPSTVGAEVERPTNGAPTYEDIVAWRQWRADVWAVAQDFTAVEDYHRLRDEVEADIANWEAIKPPPPPPPTRGRSVPAHSALAAPAPAAPTGSGPTPDQWAALRNCEATGNYGAVNPSGKYRGAYQFDQRTWESVGGVGDPAAASPAEQDLRAQILYDSRGNRPWPQCGRYLP